MRIWAGTSSCPSSGSCQQTKATYLGIVPHSSLPHPRPSGTERDLKSVGGNGRISLRSWVSYAVDLMRELDCSTGTLRGLVAPLFLPGLGSPTSVGSKLQTDVLTCTVSPRVLLGTLHVSPFRCSGETLPMPVPGHRHLCAIAFLL